MENIVNQLLNSFIYNLIPFCSSRPEYRSPGWVSGMDTALHKFAINKYNELYINILINYLAG
jgi:hypothetical protein